MILTFEQRQDVVRQVRREMQHYYDNILLPLSTHHVDIHKYCLFWAFFTMKELRERGITDAIIQAGSAFWPIVREKDDDGVSPNQFGYTFEWTLKASEDFCNGDLPEMHVWVAIVKPPAIETVDLTVSYFKKRAIEEGYQVDVDDPPDFFWHEGVNLPFAVSYIADPIAIEIAYAFLRHAFARLEIRL